MNESILDHHTDAFGRGDVDAIVEDFTEESTIIFPKSVITGLDNIMHLFFVPFLDYMTIRIFDNG